MGKLKAGDKFKYRVVVEFIVEEELEDVDLDTYHDKCRRGEWPQDDTYVEDQRAWFEEHRGEIGNYGAISRILAYEGEKVLPAEKKT